MRIHHLLAAVFLAGTLLGQSDPVTPKEFRDITYLTASGQEQKLDVFQHPGAKAPVIVYFHGGAWWKGQRPASWHGFREFLELGFSVVSADYRLAGVAPAPAAVQDTRCVLSWIKKNAATYSFDAERIVVYGTSAGGHLALLAAFLPSASEVDLPECAPVPKVSAVLDFYGVVDVTRWLGTEHMSPQAAKWLLTDGDRLVLGRQMSPITHVRAALPPVFMVHGDADPVVPYSQSIALQKALTAAGVPNQLLTVDGGKHGKFTTQQRALISAAVASFLSEHVLGKKGPQSAAGK